MSYITARSDLGTKFGSCLLKRRKECQISQERLAELTGVKRELISKYEQGKTIPNVFFLLKASRALNCSYEYLLGESEYEKPQYEDIEEMLGLSRKSIVTLEQLSSVKNSVYVGNKELLDTINMLIEHTGGYNRHLLTYDKKLVSTGKTVENGLVNKINKYLMFDEGTATYSTQRFMKGKSISSETEINTEVASNLFIMDINNSLVELRKESAPRRSRARAEHSNNQISTRSETNQGENND